MARRTVRLRITGRVQGVGFRDWMIGRARGLKLDGWVRNSSDGSVEALVAGEAALIDTMVAACQSGPRAARVLEVSVTTDSETPPQGFGHHPSV